MSDALRGLLGRVGGWHLHGFIGDILVFVLHRRISMCRVRMERLIGLYLAGTLRRRAPRVVLAREAGAREAVVREAKVREKRIWPAQSGWLLRALAPHSWEAGQHGGPLRLSLESAEMQAFLVAVPQAARILGPICRMLAIERAVYQPGFVAKVRAARDPLVKRVRKARPTVDWGRIPLPRGALVWAKRERQLERARAEVARLRKARLG